MDKRILRNLNVERYLFICSLFSDALSVVTYYRLSRRMEEW
jgi:hypothetical protein